MSVPQNPNKNDQFSQIVAHISPAMPRQTVQITLDDGRILQGPIGELAGTFLYAAQTDYDAPLIAAIYEGQLRELTYPLERDGKLSPVLLSSSDGGRIYRRSLVLLLATAADELWPGCKVTVRYAIADGGFYCTRQGETPFTQDEITQLENHMRAIVRMDAPITKRTVPLQEALALFEEREEHDKTMLLEERHKPTMTLYGLRGREDYYYGYMVASSGYLQVFRLIWTEDGFVLQYPRRENPDHLRDIRAYDKLSTVFHQADSWLERLGVENIGRLNRVVRQESKLRELILVAEALHEQNVARIAREIAHYHEQQATRLVLMAGPSSAGKTTFSKRLAIQLLAYGLHPMTLELDNYFVNRELTPRDEKGEYDFEALEAVNLPMFNEHLLQLINGQTVQLPRFDFHSGKSVLDRFARLDEHQIIIIEGIHGLNPGLVPDVPPELIYRVYVSALTGLNIDSHNRVPTTDIRLLRRIARDAYNRGYNATDTISRWGSVRRGEKRNIFPYQENADSMFNSALLYELAALRPVVEPLLLQIQPNTPPHVEAKRLLNLLSWVHPMTNDQLAMVPDTSLLREFIGKSILKDYHPDDFSQSKHQLGT